MIGKLLERLLHLVPVLLGVSLIVYLMMALTPGDPVEIMLGDSYATPEQEAALRHDMGLDLPLYQRFFRFLSNAITGNFGLSFFHRRPVMEVIADRIPATIELTMVAMLIALLTSIPLGVIAALRKDTLFDKSTTVVSLVGISTPSFWLGILLLVLFAVKLQILPVAGRISYSAETARITGLVLMDSLIAGRIDSFLDALSHIILPAVSLGLPLGAILLRVTRSSMLQVLHQGYITSARARGLTRARTVWRHALKNALIPTITVAALQTGALLGGNMIVETVFGWPGLGRLVVEAIFARNYPLVQAAVLIYALTYVLVNFFADALYTVLNPRVRL